jgi:hypothetical protein
MYQNPCCSVASDHIDMITLQAVFYRMIPMILFPEA